MSLPDVASVDSAFVSTTAHLELSCSFFAVIQDRKPRWEHPDQHDRYSVDRMRKTDRPDTRTTQHRPQKIGRIELDGSSGICTLPDATTSTIDRNDHSPSPHPLTITQYDRNEHTKSPTLAPQLNQPAPSPARRWTRRQAHTCTCCKPQSTIPSSPRPSIPLAVNHHSRSPSYSIPAGLGRDHHPRRRSTHTSRPRARRRMSAVTQTTQPARRSRVRRENRGSGEGERHWGSFEGQTSSRATPAARIYHVRPRRGI